jgi:MFS family permease
VFGVYAGAFAVAAVDIERTFNLSDAQLGFLLAAGIIAATGLVAVGGIIIDRWGAGLLLARAVIAWGCLLLLEGLAPHVALYVPAFILAVSAGGMLDVVLNVSSAEALSAQPGKLVRFHSLWNFACVLGAIVCGVILRVGWSWRVMWVGLAVVVIIDGIATYRAKIPSPEQVEHPSMWRALVGLRHEGLTVLACVFAASAMVEGGIATFGVLYLRAHVGLGVLAGVGAYVVGNLLAMGARFGGASIVDTLGTRRSVMFGALIAAAGITIEVTAPAAWLAAAGLAAASAGVSLVWPLLMADVSNEARHPALAIGGVTAAGYLGMVAGPPIVGVVAVQFGRPAGLMVLAFIALFVALTPAHVRTTEPQTA